MIRQIFVDKYAEVLRHLKDHDGKFVDFYAVCRNYKVNAGLRSQLIKHKLIEADSRGFIKVLYHDSEPLHARRFLEQSAADAQKKLKTNNTPANPLIYNSTLLVARVKSLLVELDYEALTDAQAKEVLMLEQILKRFEK